MYSRGEFCAAVAPFLWKLPSFRFFEKKLGKKLYWVPYTFRVSEGSAGSLHSGSLVTFVPAARYDANFGVTRDLEYEAY